MADFRKSLGITQAQLAKAIGFGQPRIANYEKGTRTPSVFTARKIVDGLNALGATCSIDDVFPADK